MDSLHRIQGSRDQHSFDSSAGLIAVFHALHRLLAPRHPPHALSSLAALTPASLNPQRGGKGQGRPLPRPGRKPGLGNDPVLKGSCRDRKKLRPRPAGPPGPHRRGSQLLVIRNSTATSLSKSRAVTLTEVNGPATFRRLDAHVARRIHL